MDLARIRKTVKEFADVLDDEERPRALERLIRKLDLEERGEDGSR